MAYDGMYSELSTRGSVNEALATAIQARDAAIAASVAAGVSESNADISENNAELSSDAAGVSASSAASSANSASSSATTATDAASSAMASNTDVTTKTARFLFPAATAPVLRDNGDPLEFGDRYLNTVDNIEYLYETSGWVVNNLDMVQLASPTGATFVGAVRPAGSDGTVQQSLDDLETITDALKQSATQGVVGGTANAITAAFTPPFTAITDDMVVRIKATGTNTTTVTFNPDGLGAAAVVGLGHAALQGGEILNTGDVWLQRNNSIGGGSWVLIASSGGGQQIAPATQTKHSIRMDQMSALLGAKNAKMSIATAGTTGTFTADQVSFRVGLGGQPWFLSSFSAAINTAASGVVGGMDTGLAPVSGYVAIYGIFNPTTAASGVLLQDTTSAVASATYSGANPVSGYTASVLLAVWPTNASRQLVAGYWQDLSFTYLAGIQVLSTNSTAGSNTNLSIAGAVPRSAKTISGIFFVSSTNATAGAGSLFLYPSLAATGVYAAIQGAVNNVFGINGTFTNLALTTVQNLVYQAAGPATPLFVITLAGYSI